MQKHVLAHLPKPPFSGGGCGLAQHTYGVPIWELHTFTINDRKITFFYFPANHGKQWWVDASNGWWTCTHLVRAGPNNQRAHQTTEEQAAHGRSKTTKHENTKHENGRRQQTPTGGCCASARPLLAVETCCRALSTGREHLPKKISKLKNQNSKLKISKRGKTWCVDETPDNLFAISDRKITSFFYFFLRLLNYVSN